MISMYTLNLPAAACLLTLLCVLAYQLYRSRDHEMLTSIFPSSLNIENVNGKLCISSEDDIVINTKVAFDELYCRTLYVGPMGILEGDKIQVDRVVSKGRLESMSFISARDEIQLDNYAEVFGIKTPLLRIGKNAQASIQIVPKETRVKSRRGAKMKGFFTSMEEFQNQFSEAKELSRRVTNPRIDVESQNRIARLKILRRKAG